MAAACRQADPVANVAAGLLDGRIYVPGGSTAERGRERCPRDLRPRDRDLGDRSCAAPTADGLRPGGVGRQAVPVRRLGREPASRGDVDFRCGDPTWSEGTPLPGPRAFSGATVLKDVIYVVGGHDGRSSLTDVLAYDPAARARNRAPGRAKAPLKQPRAGLAVVGVGAQVFALGGGWDGSEAYNEQYDTRLDAWSRLGSPMPGEWRNLAAAPLNNRIYAVGGWSGAYLDTHEQYVALILQLIPLAGAGLSPQAHWRSYSAGRASF